MQVSSPQAQEKEFRGIIFRYLITHDQLEIFDFLFMVVETVTKMGQPRYLQLSTKIVPFEVEPSGTSSRLFLLMIRPFIEAATCAVRMHAVKIGSHQFMKLCITLDFLDDRKMPRS